MGDALLDVIVIGGGVAGLTVAATAAESGLSTMLIEHLAPGGQIATVEHVWNFPGHPEGIGGHELGPLLLERAEEAGAELLFDTVEAIVPAPDGFDLRCSGHSVRARALIVATGSTRRTLGIPGEKEYEGKGVSHCAACDGPLFRNKHVIVVGGGDSAFDEAYVLAGHVGEITIVHSTSQPKARPEALDRLARCENVLTIGNARPVEIVGDQHVVGVRIDRPGGASWIPAEAVFVYTGLVPNNGLLQGLVEIDASGRIVADEAMRTSRPGLFVAGDLRSGSPALLSSAADDGAIAAASAWRFLTDRR